MKGFEIMDYKILAADDEVELIDILELYLSRENMILLKAKDGMEAIYIFNNEDVICFFRKKEMAEFHL